MDVKEKYSYQVKIFVTVTLHLIGISIVYRCTCVYNIKIYWHK